MTDTTITTSIDNPNEIAEKVRPAALSYLEVCSNFVVADDESLAHADAHVKDGMDQKKRIIAFFKPLKDATHKAHKEVVAKEKEAIEPVENGSRLLSKKIIEYKMDLEKKRLALLKRQAEADRKRQEKAAEEMRQQGLSEPEIQEEIPMLPTPPRKEIIVPKTSVRMRKSVEFIGEINALQIPPQYRIVTANEKRIKEDILASNGQIKIPGVRYKITQTPVRG